MNTSMNFKQIILIACVSLFACATKSQQVNQKLSFDFLGNTISIQSNPFSGLRYTATLSETSIQDFISKLKTRDYQPLINTITSYRDNQHLDDWLFYQVIRKTAEQISPKAENYFSYTIYKWFLLSGSGYDAILRIDDSKMLFYVQSDEAVYNIPYIYADNKQYVCLNYHDYGNNIDFEKEHFQNVNITIDGAKRSFTYKVSHLPDIKSGDYIKKDIGFNYYQQQYHFTIKLNPEIKNIFKNYPTADYSNQFSIPLSKETYNSLIPQLKEVISPMSITNGVDYLMRFTRYSFLFEKDTLVFGREKRLSAEETLLYDQSDCEDRAALFFYLVKEIYNLPMIVLSYPNHVTVAVNFDKPVGKPIIYNGSPYYVCESTPQKKDLDIGRSIPGLDKEGFEVVYAYQPNKK